MKKNKHNLSYHPLHQIWRDIKKRCYNNRCKRYKWYGKRGIQVCEEWRNDFQKFYDWCIENSWEKGLQIDRIDNNGNYEPSNCRFITCKQNCNNRNSNIKITIYNETKSIMNWSEDNRCVVPYKTLYSRIVRSNWDPLLALTTPKNIHKKSKPINLVMISAFNETKSLNEWLKDDKCSINRSCLYSRIKRNWNPEKAITEPCK